MNLELQVEGSGSTNADATANFQGASPDELALVQFAVASHMHMQLIHMSRAGDWLVLARKRPSAKRFKGHGSPGGLIASHHAPMFDRYKRAYDEAESLRGQLTSVRKVLAADGHCS